ncbi:MAG: hypothetical protein LBV71_20615 [Prevotella sp.]|jgi:hypothetical protein|nr:hypothetical protein [Prevotella sp.]
MKEYINIVLIRGAGGQLEKNILPRIRARFVCYVDDRIDEDCYELEFVSGKPSPKEELGMIVENYHMPDLYLQLVSYELSDEYLEHHVLKNGVWIDKIREKCNLKNAIII